MTHSKLYSKLLTTHGIRWVEMYRHRLNKASTEVAWTKLIQYSGLTASSRLIRRLRNKPSQWIKEAARVRRSNKESKRKQNLRKGRALTIQDQVTSTSLSKRGRLIGSLHLSSGSGHEKDSFNTQPFALQYIRS